jgi:hypothetical protein
MTIRKSVAGDRRNIVPDLLAPGGLKGAFVRVPLDGHRVVDYASAGLSMETTQLLVVVGFDASRAFRGQIDYISIIKSNRT